MGEGTYAYIPTYTYVSIYVYTFLEKCPNIFIQTETELHAVCTSENWRVYTHLRVSARVSIDKLYNRITTRKRQLNELWREVRVCLYVQMKHALRECKSISALPILIGAHGVCVY